MSLKDFMKACNDHAALQPSFREEFRSLGQKCHCGFEWELQSIEDHSDVYSCPNAECNNMRIVWDRV